MPLPPPHAARDHPPRWRPLDHPMARFLLVLQPRDAAGDRALIDALHPLLEALQAEVEHRTAAHLSALVRSAPTS